MLSTSPSDSAPLLQIGDRALTAAELVQSLGRYQLILPLVRQVVLEQALISVECSPKEQAQAIQSFYEQQQITDAAQRLNWCQKQRLTETDIQHLAVQSIKLEKFKHATWASQVESYFLKRKSQLDRVIYRLIRTQDAHLAQEIYLRLQDDHASFADLARTYSQGPEAQTGAWLVLLN
ncbi:MAG: peptidylprolyl isomerase [Cyanobacteria bacterium P01_H01_bin.121]